MRKLERLDTRHVKDWKWYPENGKSEKANHSPESVGKNHPPPRTCPFRWTGEILVKYFVQAVQNAADANDDISKKSIIGGTAPAWLAPGCSTMLSWGFGILLIPISHDE